MATVVQSQEEAETFADLLERIGDVPLNRILIKPAPGTATENDLTAAIEAPRRRLCQLVEAVLVEKTVGARESMRACCSIQWLLECLQKDEAGLWLSRV